MAPKRKSVGRKSGQGPTEAELEAQMKRKFYVKCRFRAIVRLALANAHWLTEDEHRYEGIDDVHRRVSEALRKRSKKGQRTLTLKDKALLCKPASERTHEETRYIYRIIGGLKCFKRYPNVVKRKLAAATYFKYYGPDRMIVRENDEAYAMYFLLSGEISVTQLVYNELENKYESVQIGKLGYGDQFGEVSLLHDIPRTATCTTVTELLMLKKEDFKIVLKNTLQESWDVVYRAMSCFTYFDSLDQVAIREGSIAAKLKSYDANDTILGDGVGVPNFVYFVLTGTCQLIESLRIEVITGLGRTHYRLHDPFYSETSKSDKDETNFETGLIGKVPSCDRSPPLLDEQMSEIRLQSTSGFQVSLSYIKSISQTNKEFKRVSMKQSKGRKESDPIAPEESKVLLPPTERLPRDSVRFSVVEDNDPQNLRTVYMEVAQFNAGSTFGLGENMRDRRIVALTPVFCMLLPKVWLLENNIANIWTRIQHFLKKKIPSKKKLFDIFVMEQRWRAFKENIVEDVVSRTNAVNFTTVHDIPYCIRLQENIDI